MSCTNGQQRGATTRLIMDVETAPKTAPAYASRNPWAVPYNTYDVNPNRPLNSVELIRGDRNPSEPFDGFLAVEGSLTVPADSQTMPRILTALLGAPTSYLDHNPEVSGQNHMTGTPSLTIAASGAYTFSAAQTSSADEDIVVYTDGSAVYTARIDTRTDDTTGVLQTLASTPGDPATGTFTVLAIIDTLAGYFSAELNVLAGGVFDTVGGNWSNVAIQSGDLIIYGNGLVARTTSAIGTPGSNDFMAVMLDGTTPATGTGFAAHAVIRAGRIRHLFTTSATACAKSLTFERQMEDLDVPFFERTTGVKVNELAINYGEDAELVYTFGLMGCGVVRGYQPYDRPSHMTGTGGTLSITSGAATTSVDHTTSAVGDLIIYRTGTSAANYQYFAAKITVRSSGTSYTVAKRDGTAVANVSGATVIAIYPPAIADGRLVETQFGRRLTNAGTGLTLNGVTGRVKTAAVTIAGNLDGDTYEMDGTGERAGLVEGLFSVAAEISARFPDTRILELGTSAAAFATSITSTTLGHTVTLTMPTCRLVSAGPTMQGPAGVTFDGQLMAYKPTGGAAALSVSILNQVGSY